MVRLNENFAALKQNYVFLEVKNRVAAYQRATPNAGLIHLGVGDVCLPLAPCVVDAMEKAAAEQKRADAFRGYPPAEGYAFLRDKISEYYSSFGVDVPAADTFVSDGAKSEIGGLFDLFSRGQKILIVAPSYPVYADVAALYGHKIGYLCADKDNDFLPSPPLDESADIVFLCSPGNPTGAAYDRAGLAAWVEYAKRQGALLIFDAAYEAFAQENKARSVFEVDGAKACAVEICSFSKTAGFTGMRCGYTVIPSELKVGGAKLKDLWIRRLAVRFNGVSYVVQRGAEAALSSQGIAYSKECVAYYKNNAQILSSALKKAGVWHAPCGNSPYVWCACPKGVTSWEFFDLLVKKANVIGTPGAGFGFGGEGFFRFSAFCLQEDAILAGENIQKLLR